MKKQVLTLSCALENDKIKSAISACTEGRTFKEVLERTQWAFQEANVLAVESFFHYSTTRYQVVLGCLEALRARPEVSLTNEDVISPVLREVSRSAVQCLALYIMSSDLLTTCIFL